jgi:hypothetical protein
MKRDKIWFNDRISSGKIHFFEGDKVIVFRRKANGYPRALEDGKVYEISKKECDFLYLIEPGVKNEYDSSGFITSYKNKEIKVHRSYVIPISINRSNLIENILSGIVPDNK